MSSPLPADISIDTNSGADDTVSDVDFDAKINPNDVKQSCIRGFLHRVQEETVGTIGVVAGLVMAVKAMKTWADLSFITSTIEKIQRAKSVHVSDLRYIGEKGSEAEKVVIVRGFVRPQNSYCPTVKSQATGSSIEGVLLKTITCEYQDDLWLPIPKVSLIATPMAICSSTNFGWKSCVNIDLKEIDSLPLETTYRKGFLHVINPFFYGVKEEKILPVGKEITAIGRVTCKGSSYMPRLEACDDLPYFVSGMTKDQMLKKLIWKKYVLLFGGVALGSLSIYVLSITLRRYLRRRKLHQQNQVMIEEGGELRRRLKLVKSLIATRFN